MTVSREAFVGEARSWIGTPWVHQAHKKGLGCDCAGLIRGVIWALGLADRHRPEYILNYSMSPDGVMLKAECDKWLIPIARADMRPGDVVLFKPDKRPQHMGILADYPNGEGVLSLIHGSNGVRPQRVIETRLMFARNLKFVAAYQVPGVE